MASGQRPASKGKRRSSDNTRCRASESNGTNSRCAKSLAYSLQDKDDRDRAARLLVDARNADDREVQEIVAEDAAHKSVARRHELLFAKDLDKEQLCESGDAFLERQQRIRPGAELSTSLAVFTRPKLMSRDDAKEAR